MQASIGEPRDEGEQPPAQGAQSPVARRLRVEEAQAVARLKAAAFGVDLEADRTRARRWPLQAAHLLDTDPEGSFAVDRGGRLVGVAQAVRRESLWCLSLLVVDPSEQGSGVGGALMARALEYGAREDPGVIPSSNDPRALRLYGLAGFTLRPTLEAEGRVSRAALPRAHAGIRDAGEADLEELAAISRELRGAPHTPDLRFALRGGARLLRLGERGFALLEPGRGVALLAARDESAATALLWHALERLGDAEEVSVRWITGEQRWAINVALRAGLRLSAYGALCVRRAPGPLRPYLPSGPFG